MVVVNLALEAPMWTPIGWVGAHMWTPLTLRGPLVPRAIQELGVGRRIHQLVQVGRVRQFDDEHPALTIWVTVDQLRRIAQRLVYPQDGAADGREPLRGGLDRFDVAEVLARAYFARTDLVPRQ